MITNTFVTEFVDLLGVGENGSSIFKVYPNPASTQISVSLSEELSKIQIYDFMGKVVLQKDIDGGLVDLDVSTLKSGVYLLKIESGEGKVAVRKVIIK